VVICGSFKEGKATCRRILITVYTRTAILWSLQWALSAVRIETALVNNHVFARFVASCSVLPVNHLTILSAASQLEWTLTAASLRLHAFTIGVQMKSWQQCYIFRSSWGLLRHTQAGARDFKSRRYNSDEVKSEWNFDFSPLLQFSFVTMFSESDNFLFTKSFK
jgi:hypothetical protein